MCDVTHDLKIPSPFTDCHTFSDPSLPREGYILFWTSLIQLQKRNSVIHRLSKPKLSLFRRCALLRPNPRALPVIYVCSSAWNCLPQSLCLELLSLSPLQLRKRFKTFLFADPGLIPFYRERCWCSWSLEWHYFLLFHYITLLWTPHFFSYLWVENCTFNNFKEFDFCRYCRN